ncbi:PAS domain S-box protein [uncultured Pseudacidovorax sp.]|uniref:PAS domain S-box protein n=1 Tax=uncultured Pseudacidovorax sp. TaxID=679313 RepID=UPI0025CE29A6|nr:PAS domain S-box protein [uncultured Pseudacidovorax sp.]
MLWPPSPEAGPAPPPHAQTAPDEVPARALRLALQRRERQLRRIGWLVLLLVPLLLATRAGMAWHTLREGAETRALQHANALAQWVAADAVAHQAGGAAALSTTALLDTLAGAHGDHALLLAADGRVLAASRGAPVSPGEASPALAPHDAIVADQAVPGHRLRVQVVQPLAPLRRALLQQVRLGAALSLFAMAVVLVALRALATGIRERRKAESAMARLHLQGARQARQWRADQARHRAVLDSALDAILTADARGRIVDTNPAAERMFGIARAQLLGRPIQRLLAPGPSRRALRRQALQLLRGPGAQAGGRLAVRARHAGGHAFPAEATVVAVHGGLTPLFTATVRDLSRQQRVELALRDSEARARATFEQAAVGILLQDATGRLMRVNQTLCRLLGQTAPAALLGLDMQGLLHPLDAPPVLHAVRQLFGGASASLRQEARLLRADGRALWVRLTASLARDDDGRVLYMIGIVEDIEEQRQSREDLRAARQRELQIGARIQASLLVAAPALELPGLWLSSFNQASQHIDGDFFEAMRPGPQCVDLIAGDVMGKGVNAALLGAAVKMQFSRSLVELMMQPAAREAPPSPAAIVNAVHDAMTPHLQALETFVTLAYVRIDLARGLLTWCGCGHEEVVHVGPGGAIGLLRNQHPPLGVLAHMQFTQQSRPLAAGDALLLHSDGLCDARRPDGERVGVQQVHGAFRRLAGRHATPGALLHRLRQLLLAGTELTDDVTLAAVRVGEPAQAGRRIELPPGTPAIARLRALVEQGLAEAGARGVAADLFTVAVVEAFTNIVRHSRGLLPQAPVEALVQRRSGALVVELVYIGEPYTPPAQPPITQFDDYPEGGFGLTIIRKACDRVDHLHHDGVNTVRLAHWLDDEAACAAESLQSRHHLDTVDGVQSRPATAPTPPPARQRQPASA